MTSPKTLMQAKEYLDSLGITGLEMHALQTYLEIKEWMDDPANENKLRIDEIIDKEESSYLEDDAGSDLYDVVREIASA